MKKSHLETVFDKYIKGTEPQAIVRVMVIKMCTLTNEVRNAINFPTESVYISTKVIKKLYDKRPAEEHDFLLHHGWRIIHYPERIYRNKDGKRGDYLFCAKLHNQLYVASIETSNYAGQPILYLVSMFRVRKETYLHGYDLIWSWKGGTPSS